MPGVEEPQSLEEILSQPPDHPRSLVGSGLLYAQTKMVVYGRYKALKSMLGLDLAFSLASGHDWVGFSTPAEGTKVMYLQLEIPYGLLRKRLEKTWQYRQSNQPVLEQPIFWTQHWLKLDQSEGFNLVEHFVKKHRPSVLIIDPLYKVISGNLLAAVDVQRVLDNIDILIGRYNLSVIIISHTRKGIMDMGEWGSDDLLGSVFLSAWADTVVKVERRSDDRLIIKFDVVRHAEEELEQREVVFDRGTLVFVPVSVAMLQPTDTKSEGEKQ